MKEVIGVIIFFLLAMTVGGGISAMFFTSIVGGGVSESYLYPIYGGIVLLAGLIAICTAVILLFAKLFDGSFFNLIDAEYLNLQGCRQIS